MRNKIPATRVLRRPWVDLILLALIVFVVFIDRVAKFTVGAKGIVFEQRRIAAVAGLQSGSGTDKLAGLTKVLEAFGGQEKDIWSRMIIYRISLRALLRRICEEKNVLDLKETTPMVDMLSALAKKEIITKDFAENLDRVRNTTFFFEWGTGPAPEEEEIQYVEKNANAYYDVVYGPVSAFWQQRLAIQDVDQVSFHTERSITLLNRSPKGYHAC